MKYLFDIDGKAYEVELSEKEEKRLEYKKGKFAKVSLRKISKQPTEDSVGAAYLRVEFDNGNVWNSKDAVIPHLMSENEDERTRIGQRIAELRKAKKMTQTELAAQCGLYQGHIARIEKGKYNFQLDTLSQIAKALGMKIDFIKE